MSVESRRAAARKGARTRRRMANARTASRRTPPGAIGPNATHTMLSLVVLYDREHRATVRAVVAETGRRSHREIQEHLVELASHGLVHVGIPGALRPLVTAHQLIHRKETTA